MPKYSITIEGENYSIALDGNETHLFGFITTRRVKADNVKNAEKIALGMVNNDESLLVCLDENVSVKPRVYVTDIVELKWWNRLGGGGYSFFPMEED